MFTHSFQCDRRESPSCFIGLPQGISVTLFKWNLCPVWILRNVVPHHTKSFQILLIIVSPAISRMELCVYCEVWIPCFIFPWTASFPSSISSLVCIFSTDVQCHFVTSSFYLYRSVFSLLQFYIFFMMPLFLYCVFLSCRVAPPFFLFFKIIPTFSLLL